MIQLKNGNFPSAILSLHILEVLLAYFPHCGSFVDVVSTLWKFCYHSFHSVKFFFSIFFPYCGRFFSMISTLWKFSIILSTLWRFCYYTFHIVRFSRHTFHIWEVFLPNFQHCGSFVIILSTLWIISHNAFHILEDITVFQAFLPQIFFYLHNFYYPHYWSFGIFLPHF